MTPAICKVLVENPCGLDPRKCQGSAYDELKGQLKHKNVNVIDSFGQA